MTHQFFVEPEVFLLGYTTVNTQGVVDYLEASGNEEFLETLDQAQKSGVEPAEALISLYAKLCYKSLTLGHNDNLSRIRDIKNNIEGIFKQAHGSVTEHVGINFVVTNCSRVFTHEQVRHRVGSAYSQTSGRYCAISPGSLQVVWDPILEGCEDLAIQQIKNTERLIYLMECQKGLRIPPPDHPDAPADKWYNNYTYEPEVTDEAERLKWQWIRNPDADFNRKKKLTSAFRRFAPNGQSNEIGMSLNIRTIRHTILMRTSRYAEWEIRKIYESIYRLVKDKFPLLFADAREEVIDGIVEVTGMKMNPYDKDIAEYSNLELAAELNRRGIGVNYEDAIRDNLIPADSCPEEPKGSAAEEEGSS